MVALLAPHEAAEGVGPANRAPDLPGAGSLLMPPWHVTKFEPEGIELSVQFSRYHVGGNKAVHGGVLPLLFDSMFGMVIHATGPRSCTWTTGPSRPWIHRWSLPDGCEKPRDARLL